MSRPSRRAWAIGLVVAASLCALVAVPALWVNRQILNTGNWTATSTRLLEQPRIRTQISAFLVDELYGHVDVTAAIGRLLPTPLAALAQPAATRLHTVAQNAADDLLGRPRVQILWAEANRTAQSRLLQVLEGHGAYVTARGQDITLDLRAVLEQLAQRVGIGARIVGALPPGAAQITIMRAERLPALQTGLKILRGLPAVLVGLSLALFGGALLVAPRWRREAVRAYGFGLVAAGLGGLLIRSVGGNALVATLVRTAAAQPAAHDAWTIATTLLVQAAGAALLYGAALVTGAWLAGRTRPAVAMRRLAAPYARRPALAYAALALLALGVLLWAPTPALRNPVTATFLILLLAAGYEVLRRQIVREHPDAPTGDPAAWLRGFPGRARSTLERRRAGASPPPATQDGGHAQGATPTKR